MIFIFELLYSLLRSFCQRLSLFFSKNFNQRIYFQSKILHEKVLNMFGRYFQLRCRLNSVSRPFHLSIVRPSADIFHIQDDADFQKEVLESKKPFLVDFYARW